MSVPDNRIKSEPAKWPMYLGLICAVFQIEHYCMTHCFLGGDLPNNCGTGALFDTSIMVAFWCAMAVPWLWWWYRHGRRDRESKDEHGR